MCPVSKVATLIGRPRDLARDQAIRNAAVTLMHEVGFDRTTMDEIAVRAKVSKTTVYRRWKNKQELISDVVAEHSSYSIPSIDTGSLRGDLIELISAHIDQLNGPEGALMMGLMTSAQRDPEIAKLVMECAPSDQDPQVDQLIERALKRGDISKNANFELIAESVSAIIMHRLLITRQTVNRKYIEALVDGLLIPALKKK